MSAGFLVRRAPIERDTHQPPGRSGPSGRVAANAATGVVDFIARRLEPPTRASAAGASATTAISIQAVIAMTGRSQRTWWRRIEDGTVRKLKPDARGRARIALQDVLELIGCGVPSEDIALLVQADAGDAEAQADIGEMFISTGRPDAGRYWLELAAEQGHPNAMQCLARCYLSGEGAPKNENMAIRWLADAAAHGHVIAGEQMRALRERPSACGLNDSSGA